ncbi:MAG: N-acetylmuramic acid 6-phosphate etherase [bacterium]|nr:N-acetylmuramic acid 6-phosphate etherase [bacterium]
MSRTREQTGATIPQGGRPLPPARHDRRLTEQRNSRSSHVDRATVREALAIIQAEDRRCCEAAEACAAEVAAAIERVVAAFRQGGRLIYVGAGTSGRLGVLDASEQPPTFGVPADMVQGVIAGGYEALHRAVEGAEDDLDSGARAMAGKEVSRRDVVFGIATGGRTPYVLGALAEARRRGAATVLLTCTPPLEGEEDLADVQIHALVGPEVVTGSTRMKAGTVTKLILNQVTTVAMIQMGKVYENLMVDLRPTNAKLVDRARRILAEVAGLEPVAAAALLERAGGDLKRALVMALAGVGADEAARRLVAAEGHVARAIREARGAVSGTGETPSI